MKGKKVQMLHLLICGGNQKCMQLLSFLISVLPKPYQIYNQLHPIHAFYILPIGSTVVPQDKFAWKTHETLVLGENYYVFNFLFEAGPINYSFC